jgi:hypothetical protein
MLDRGAAYCRSSLPQYASRFKRHGASQSRVAVEALNCGGACSFTNSTCAAFKSAFSLFFSGSPRFCLVADIGSDPRFGTCRRIALSTMDLISLDERRATELGGAPFLVVSLI